MTISRRHAGQTVTHHLLGVLSCHTSPRSAHREKADSTKGKRERWEEGGNTEGLKNYVTLGWTQNKFVGCVEVLFTLQAKCHSIV